MKLLKPQGLLQRKHPGFTSPEFIVCSLLMFLVTSSFLPNLMMHVHQQTKRMAFQETISVLSEASYKAHLTHSIQQNKDSAGFFKKQLRWKAYCDGSQKGSNCNQPLDFSANTQPMKTFTLQNGATVTGFVPAGESKNCNEYCMQWVIVDYNGAALPNKAGDDQVVLWMALGKDNPKAGRLVNYPTTSDLYHWIFS